MERLVGCRNFSIPYIITLSVTKEMNDTANVSGVSHYELLGMELCQHNDSNDRALPCVRA